MNIIYCLGNTLTNYLIIIIQYIIYIFIYCFLYLVLTWNSLIVTDSSAVKVKSIQNLEIYQHDLLILVIFVLIDCSVFSACSWREENSVFTCSGSMSKAYHEFHPLSEKTWNRTRKLYHGITDNAVWDRLIQKIFLDHSKPAAPKTCSHCTSWSWVIAASVQETSTFWRGIALL